MPLILREEDLGIEIVRLKNLSIDFQFIRNYSLDKSFSSLNFYKSSHDT